MEDGTSMATEDFLDKGGNVSVIHIKLYDWLGRDKC
jgi:hypothetical protein